MSSVRARLAKKFLRSQFKPDDVGHDFVDEIRARISGRPLPVPLGRAVGARSVAAGELDDVEGEWVGVPGARRHLLYLHGGYYIGGVPTTYRSLTARLAVALGAEVLLPDYRLAPEHPYPAAVDDAVAAYRALLARGADPARTAVAGDSAGGGLCLSMLLRLRAEGLPMPGAAVLLSPWTDLTCTAPSIDRNDEADDMLTAAALRHAAELYAGSTPRDDPGLSPLLGDLAGLPPLFVTVDSSEALLDDALRLVERARGVGTHAELHRRDGLFHVWPVLAPLLPEARRTVDDIVTFLDRTLPDRVRPTGRRP